MDEYSQQIHQLQESLAEKTNEVKIYNWSYVLLISISCCSKCMRTLVSCSWIVLFFVYIYIHLTILQVYGIRFIFLCCTCTMYTLHVYHCPTVYNCCHIWIMNLVQVYNCCHIWIMNLVQDSLCAGIGVGVTKSVSPAYNCMLFKLWAFPVILFFVCLNINFYYLW